MSATEATARGATALRAFDIGFDESELTDLRRRIEATRWPERETGADDSQGDGTGQPGLVKQVLEGRLESDLTRNDLLDNITLYWLTNTGVSAARLYWENRADFFDAKDISIPFAISVFPDELYQAPRSWAERAYPDNLIHYNRLDRGGHFAAWEQPQLFTDELRAGFRSLRT